jgi:glycosyltransferase involved in cell wall biosynthesis
MNPLVTITIPTYNRLHFLKVAVASALIQTYEPIEVLIGDDGATEEIWSWSQNLARQDPRVRYQRNSRNLGLAGNWNAVADGARGKFITIIGDDDRLLPDFAAILTKAIEPGANVAFGNHYLINEVGDRLSAESHDHTRKYQRDCLPAGELKQPEAWVWQNVVPSSAALLRTDDVRRLRFREELNTPEIEFFIRLAQEGGRFVFVPDYLAEYRVHPQSATSIGLWSERLAVRLLSIPVRPEIEPYKQKFMGPLLVDAISRCLLRGESELARNLLHSEYYPQERWRRISIMTQVVCAHLPAWLGVRVYRMIYRLKSRV